jgi:AraC family transcriptional regulator
MVLHASPLSDLRHPQLRLAAASSEIDRPAPGRSNWCIGDSRHARASAEAAKLLDAVRHAMDANPEGARAAALRLVELFTPSADARFAGARGGLTPRQQRRVDCYVREHLEQSLRVEELAAQVSLSVSHFCRAFKESFGDTPHAYIIRLRLTLAQELMLATADPLSQIALACGFANQAHLSKLFRRMVGEPPNTWRRRNLIDAPAEMRSMHSFVAPRWIPGTSLRDGFGTQPEGRAD